MSVTPATTGYSTTGYRIQDTGYRIQDTGYRTQDTGYRIQDLDIGNSRLY